jgi:hypothetical protein
LASLELLALLPLNKSQLFRNRIKNLNLLQFKLLQTKLRIKLQVLLIMMAPRKKIEKNALKK